MGQRRRGTSAGPPPAALGGGLPPPVSPPHSPPCSALQDAERRQAAGPPAAKVSGVRALGSGGLCWGAWLGGKWGGRGAQQPRGGSAAPAAVGSCGEPAGGRLWESLALTPSPLTPCSYSHALDGMYRVLREGEAVPAGGGPTRGLLRKQERPTGTSLCGRSLSVGRERGRRVATGPAGPVGRGWAGPASPRHLARAGRDVAACPRGGAACRELLVQSTELEQVGGERTAAGRRRRCSEGGSFLGGPGYLLLRHSSTEHTRGLGDRLRGEGGSLGGREHE